MKYLPNLENLDANPEGEALAKKEKTCCTWCMSNLGGYIYFSGTLFPVIVFIVFYYAFWGWFVSLKGTCKDDVEPSDEVDCTKSTSIFISNETFAYEVKEYKGTHKTITRTLTFFLGFFVATMAKRWWDQVSSMPDITQVAIVLNCMTKVKEDFSGNINF